MATIVEWFDPHSIEHISAYRSLGETGHWPEGFIPADVTMPPHWQTLLAFKLAEEWVSEMMETFDGVA